MKKRGFLGSCDRIRQCIGGEEFFQKTMKNKKEITENYFLSKVNPRDVLDDDETWKQYSQTMKRQDKVRFYKSKDDIYFFQTAGFEFFWRKKK